MAVRQATAVHRDVGYDLEVDTTRSTEDCARSIVAGLHLT